MSEQEKKQILELLGMVIDSIHVITERTSHIKNIDKISKGSIFSKYPSIPWKEIKEQ